MKLISKMKEKRENERRAAIENDAMSRFNITEFNGVFYYTFNTIPVLKISPETTVKEMLSKLTELREDFKSFRKAADLERKTGQINNMLACL